MEKSTLKILVINRELNPEEKKVMNFFPLCQVKGYDMIIFPLTEEKRRTEVIYFNQDTTETLQKLFSECNFTVASPFSDFDLDEIDQEVFFEILNQKFEVIPFNLSEGLKEVKEMEA